MKLHHIGLNIKALLILGSALVFVYCGGDSNPTTASSVSQERMVTEESENLRIVMTENGQPSYIFEAPVVRGYTFAKEPYREFDEGVFIITFKDDSLSVKDAELRSNYAIYYEGRELWEVRGDVEVRKSDGKELYTQQLFWNAQTDRIYSNVETTVMDNETGDIYVGEGFESDEKMEQWSFRKLKGRMKMEVSPREANTVEGDKSSDSEEETGFETDSEVDSETDSEPDSEVGSEVDSETDSEVDSETEEESIN